MKLHNMTFFLFGPRSLLRQDLKIGAVVSLVGTTFTAAIESEDEDKIYVFVFFLMASSG
jgi:hypothetical protein